MSQRWQGNQRPRHKRGSVGQMRGRVGQRIRKEVDGWKASAAEDIIAAHVAGLRFAIEAQVPPTSWEAVSARMVATKGFHLKTFDIDI